MEVILLESIRKLGTVGSKVKVKDGFGRNFLIPRKKALRATKENLALFEEKKSQIEQENNQRKDTAKKIAVNLENLMVGLIRQAGEDGRLFGSVTARDIANAISEKGTEVDRSAVILNNPIKYTGIHSVTINLHPEVIVEVKVNVARSDAEASGAAAQLETASAAEQNIEPIAD